MNPSVATDRFFHAPTSANKKESVKISEKKQHENVGMLALSLVPSNPRSCPHCDSGFPRPTISAARSQSDRSIMLWHMGQGHAEEMAVNTAPGGGIYDLVAVEAGR